MSEKTTEKENYKLDKRVIIANFFVLLLGAVTAKLWPRSEPYGLVYAILMMFFVAALTAMNLFIGTGLYLYGKKNGALSFLISAALMLLIGFGVCYFGLVFTPF